ncbi:hypothetical protein [Lysinibacillus yapensis]|uniref:hypothetical protein n=1 Tax=Ureibacillus yapensis TaxID=2304605 RepID=UPI0011C45B1E|nr:hypothetical protein [Lysinibacillus yapensis]
MTEVGPTRDDNGFPFWYKDSNGVKLELCLDPADPYCGLIEEEEEADPATLGFDPNLPIQFPDNYPGEAFYQMAEAEIESGNVSARGTFALEASFNSEVPAVGDQTVFGRVRIRVDGLTPNSNYTITHPYGKDIIKTDAEGEINYTEDIGAGGGFNAALNSRIGTFLKWDPSVAPAAPEGYIGDPNVLHRVTGGYQNQNYFRIEGPGLGRLGRIQTNLFSLMGKISTTNGLDIQQATYSQTADSGFIDVFVLSEVDQNITVSGTGIETTPLAGRDNQYFAHVPYTGAEPPVEITVTNLENNIDDPADDTIKTIKPVDRIIASANYDTAAKTLTIRAKSSDEVNPPALTVTGYDGIIDPSTGQLAVPDLTVISPTITITSEANGTVTIPVDINNVSAAPAGMN